MTIALVIGIAAVPASAGGRAPSDVSTEARSHGSDRARVLAGPADRTPEVNYWHRHSLYWKHKAGQWRRYALRIKRGGDARVRSTRLQRVSRGVKGVICSVFGAHCSEALRVAWCESRFNIYARNGQYWGLFQFGSYARGMYGFAWNAWTQTKAAYRYFLDAGWGPWQCRP